MAVTKALSDEQRVRALAALQGGELCVCQLIELLDLAPSTVSKHLTVLRQARLVESRKDGRWMYYRLPDKDAPKFIHTAVSWVMAAMAQEKTAVEDGKRLKTILKMAPEALCCQQREAKA